MGIVHTKLRNRLTTSSAHKIVQVKMDLRARHECEGLVQPRVRRKYGPDLTPVAVEQEATDEEDEDVDEGEDVEGDVDTNHVICGLIADADADSDVDEDFLGFPLGLQTRDPSCNLVRLKDLPNLLDQPIQRISPLLQVTPCSSAKTPIVT